MADPTSLVVGLGSIGARHQRVLAELDHRVIGVSRRSGVGDFTSVASACEAVDPSYVVVATETETHEAVLRDLGATGYGGPVLVEKPMGFTDPQLLEPFEGVWVGYNLRFHPVVKELRSRLADQQIVSVQARVGQHIEDWRPGRDPATTASNGVGGGALRDLSHELDLLEWLFGPSLEVAALGGQFADLGLRVDDTWSCLLRYERANAAGLELNYLDRAPQRFVHVTTREASLVCDLIAGHLRVNGDEVLRIADGMDTSYVDMHRAILSGNTIGACRASEGFRIMHVIEAIEHAATHRAWASVSPS